MFTRQLFEIRQSKLQIAVQGNEINIKFNDE